MSVTAGTSSNNDSNIRSLNLKPTSPFPFYLPVPVTPPAASQRNFISPILSDARGPNFVK